MRATESTGTGVGWSPAIAKAAPARIAGVLDTNFLYGCAGRRLVSDVTTTSRGRSAARYATPGTLIGLGVVAAMLD
jgi:hypothetical protein